MNETTPATRWLTLDAAAAAHGISTRQLQRQIAAGQHATQKQSNGRVLVEVQPMPADATAEQVTAQLTGMTAAVTTAQQSLMVLQEHAERAQATADAALAQVARQTRRADRWIMAAVAASVTLAATSTWLVHVTQQADQDDMRHRRQMSDISAQLDQAQQQADRAQIALQHQSAAFSDVLAGMTSVTYVADMSPNSSNVSPGMVDDTSCHDVTPQQ